MEQPEFYRARKSANKAQSLVILSQSRVKEFRGSYSYKFDTLPPYRLVALDPETGCWWKLPLMPEFKAGFPEKCEMIASGSNLVVMGGRVCDNQEYVDSVFVFDFLSYKWRRGANMPGGQRWFFGCASDGDDIIYVAGGYDAKVNPHKSAWAYHVSADTWTQLPDMAHERGYCKGLFHLGKFHVIIIVYAIYLQGQQQHHQSLEIFDTSLRQWLMLDSGDHDDKIIKLSKYCVKGTDQKLYTLSDSDLVVLEDGKWKLVARLPADVANKSYITPFPGHLLLTGELNYDHPHNAYILDLKDLIWTRLEVPTEYSGHVDSGCCFTI
ncbi:F-box domain, Galactose oxidase, beta-propeller [Artemisia annua]|uniref:F-box domain, Galactose oxidase, beta-propeller n=1 Tax=Artemisia annua TaxID=35608 RepID=A0A2U1PM11_ARTAN|nr:F-box domain, Galactose oxidase, beta-propeller [Artemisia annua]